MRLLMADGEQDVVRDVRAELERRNYTVDVVDNGADVLAYLVEGDYDGVILDILIPGKDGLTILREMRQRGYYMPVLILTARGALEDRVQGLEAGADDYLAKPFAMSELLARVKALMRRAGSYTADVLRLGDLQLDCSTYEMSTNYPDAPRVRVSNKEFQILELLMRNSHRVFSTEDILRRCWSWDSESEINVVWTNIANIRRKLEQIGAHVEIHSERGVGYQLKINNK